MKVCGKCKENKPLSEFNSKGSGRVQAYCRECDKQHSREYYAANKVKMRKQIAAAKEKRGDKSYHHHGLTTEQYYEMLQRYNGKCWLCKTKPATHVDHDHNCCAGVYSCGKCIRGILCSSCNLGLGKLGDSLDSLRLAVVYLESS